MRYDVGKSFVHRAIVIGCCSEDVVYCESLALEGMFSMAFMPGGPAAVKMAATSA